MNNGIDFGLDRNNRRKPYIVKVGSAGVVLFCIIATLLFAQETSSLPSFPGTKIERLRDPSGRDIYEHKQSGIVDNWIEHSLSIVAKNVEGNPLEGVSVYFALVSQPGRAKGAKVDSLTATADANGVATTRLHWGSKAGNYVITATTVDTMILPVTFEVDAKKTSWLIFLGFGLLGGLAIFLYGMKRAACDKMRLSWER